MQIHTHNILSLVLGTRYMGFAIFNDSDLRDWFVKSLTGKTIGEKIKNLITCVSQFIERFHIDVIATKKIHPSRSSKALAKLDESIKVLVKKEHLTIYEYPIISIEHALLSGKANKKLLTEEVHKIYPTVYHEYQREKKNKNRYLTRMFEAIAMGVVCIQSLDSKQRKITHHYH
jgi:Holliday junction resolvasome RuvABC endonuclease subunit